MVRTWKAASAAGCSCASLKFACRAALCVGLLLALGAMPLLGQSTTSVVGQVTDQSGAVVVGATVTLIDVDTKTSRSTTTNETGRYVFPNLPPAVYDLGISKSGFAAAKVQGQKADIGTPLTL